MTRLSMKQHCYCVQESRSARTDSKQYTLPTEVEKTTKHQGEKDTGINCSEQIASNPALKKECTTNTKEGQAQDPRAPINSDMTQEMSNLRDNGEQKQRTKDRTDCCGEQRLTSRSTVTDSLVCMRPPEETPSATISPVSQLSCALVDPVGPILPVCRFPVLGRDLGPAVSLVCIARTMMGQVVNRSGTCVELFLTDRAARSCNKLSPRVSPTML